MPRLSSRTTLPLVILGIAVGCSSPTEQTRQFDLAGAKLDVISGDNQSAKAFTLLPQPVVVQLLNSKGRPVKGQIVTFTPTRGSGSVWGGSAITDADGYAKERWTLGTDVIDNYLQARMVDPVTGEQILLATVKAIATPWTNPQIQCAFPEQTSFIPTLPSDCPGNMDPRHVLVGASLEIRFRVVDDGVPVAGVPVSFSAERPSSIVPPTAYTGTDGVITTTFTAGNQRIANAVQAFIDTPEGPLATTNVILVVR